MTFAELVAFLDQDLQYEVLDGDAATTLTKARAGNHQDPIMGAILTAIADGCGCDDAQASLARAEVIKALGPMRLEYMADDAPVDGFRKLEFLVRSVDGAFNAEALAAKGKA